MKLALCLSGQPRRFKTAYASIEKFILSKYDVDTFIFSFEPVGVAGTNLKGQFRYPDEGTYTEFLKLYNPKAWYFEPWKQAFEDTFINLENRYKEKRSDNYVRRYLAMLFSIYMCNSLRKNHEALENFEYDYVIRLRPDAILQNFQLPNSLNLSVDCYGSSNMTGDVLACGTGFNIDYYCNLWNLVDFYFHRDGIIPNTEVLLRHHLEKINYESVKYIADIARPQGWNPD